MTKPKITVLIYTARGDHPYERRDWHCFDPVVKTLAAQTFADFELVLVDTQWETRRDWFAQHPQPFPVKHVPSSPNVWQARGRTGLPSQINRGFVWADGELVWMGGENNLFPPTHLERAWRIHEQGKIPVAWYAICGSEAGASHPDCPIDFDLELEGYTRWHVKEMDHRAKRFVADRSLQTSPGHHQHYYGYSGVPLDTALAINGFDEMFDGQWCLFDIDFGSRVDLTGKKMAFDRGLYVIEPPVVAAPYAGIGHHPAFKCHYALYLHNRLTRRQVNTPLPLNYAEDVKAKICHGACDLKVKCAAGAATPGAAARAAAGTGMGESAYYPFCEGEHRELAQTWLAAPPVRSLTVERWARRMRHAPYDRGSVFP